MALKHIYIILLGISSLLSILGVLRLGRLYVNTGIYVILAFVIQCFTLKKTGFNNYLYWIYSVASTAVILRFIISHVQHRTRKQVLRGIFFLSISFGLIYYFGFGLTKAVPTGLILFTDPVIILACAIYFVDIISKDKLDNLSKDIPFVLLSIVFLYHGLRMPYLILINEYGTEFSQNGSIVHSLFTIGNIMYYLGLSITLVIYAWKSLRRA